MESEVFEADLELHHGLRAKLGVNLSGLENEGNAPDLCKIVGTSSQLCEVELNTFLITICLNDHDVNCRPCNESADHHGNVEVGLALYA